MIRQSALLHCGNIVMPDQKSQGQKGLARCSNGGDHLKELSKHVLAALQLRWLHHKDLVPAHLDSCACVHLAADLQAAQSFQKAVQACTHYQYHSDTSAGQLEELYTYGCLAQPLLAELALRMPESRLGERCAVAQVKAITHPLAPLVVEDFCAARGEGVKDELAHDQTQDGITCIAADQIRSDQTTFIPPRPG